MSPLVGPGAAMVIAGVRDRYALAIAVAVIAVILLAVVVARRRRRRPRLDVHSLDTAERKRYLEQFAAAEVEFETTPEVAIGRARGLVEEVIRRMGFPDRIDASQKARDLAAHDREAAAALEVADRELRQGGGDRESLRRVLASYRLVLNHLLGAPPEG